MDFKTFSAICLVYTVSALSMQREETYVCQEYPADIIILVDESNSIRPTDFALQMKFVADLISAYNISPNIVKIGVISWSSWTREIWALKNADKEAVKAKIASFIRVYDDKSAHSKMKVKDAQGRDGMRDKGMNTFTWIALNDARIMLSNQRRPDVDAYVIVITDGKASWGEAAFRKVQTEAENLKKLGRVKVFGIAVGDKVGNSGIDEVKMIASDPDADYFFRAESFEELNKDLMNSLIEVCPVPTTTPMTTIVLPTHPCETNIDLLKIDLAFVVGSIYQNYPGAKKALEFISKIVGDDHLPINRQHGVQVAVVPIDSFPIGFHLNEKINKQSVLEHLEITRYMFEDTVDLINFMRDQTFSEINGDRPDAKNLAVIILDRKTPNTKATIRAAEAAKKKGIKVFAIGVGNQVDDNELLSIASGPELKFNVDSYDELWNLRDELFYVKICNPAFLQ